MEEITFDDFEKLDIRIGTVSEAMVPEWSHWVMKLTVNFGEDVGQKTIFSGIMKFYAPEDLLGKQFPFVINLKPKKIGPEGDYSEGMMIMATVPDTSNDPEKEEPVLLGVSKSVPDGSKVR